MMNRVIISILVIMLGLLVVTVPIYILPVCPPTEVVTAATDGHSHNVTFKFMKCHWIAQAEIGIGLVIMAFGLLLLLCKSILVRLGVSLSLIFVAILTAAIPTVLIGVCPGELMPCHIGTLPALLLLSAIIFVIAIINSLYLNKLSSR